jgi:acetate kinase
MILAINTGSSSLKYALFDGEQRVLSKTIGGIGPAKSHAEAVHAALQSLPSEPDAVGHRLVHGGPALFDPVRIDAKVLATLREVVPFAPLHLPPAIAAIEATQQHLPRAMQVACFDTGFHRTMPEIARRLPLPQWCDEAGVRRYGFHGLSYESAVSTLKLTGRAVIAHLGNGASLCAVRDGKSVDTTMGFTPTGGLVMGTRTGDIDPGALLFLLRERGLDEAGLERVVDRESGLLGISGETSDMRALLASSDPRAVLAVEMFCRTACKFVAAMAVSLGGIDTLVFTGGIGENATPIRERISAGVAHLGKFDIKVVAADEERVIARHVAALRVARS